MKLSKQVLLWMLGRRRLVRVNGTSMEPTLRDGSIVFVDPRAYQNRKPIPGDIIHCRHPYKISVTMVKRVESVSPQSLTIMGDNAPESTDSRSMGAIPHEHVLGRVLL